MTLPKVSRSGAQPSCAASRPYQPAFDTRKPVITSSETNSAPFSRQSRARPPLKPGSGGTTPMLPGEASVITQAISPGWARKAASTAARSLYGSTMVSPAWAPVTPGVSGSPKVARPEPAAASSASTWPW